MSTTEQRQAAGIVALALEAEEAGVRLTKAQRNALDKVGYVDHRRQMRRLYFV